LTTVPIPIGYVLMAIFENDDYWQSELGQTTHNSSTRRKQFQHLLEPRHQISYPGFTMDVPAESPTPFPRPLRGSDLSDEDESGKGKRTPIGSIVATAATGLVTAFKFVTRQSSSGSVGSAPIEQNTVASEAAVDGDAELNSPQGRTIKALTEIVLANVDRMLTEAGVGFGLNSRGVIAAYMIDNLRLQNDEVIRLLLIDVSELAHTNLMILLQDGVSGNVDDLRSAQFASVEKALDFIISERMNESVVKHHAKVSRSTEYQSVGKQN